MKQNKTLSFIANARLKDVVGRGLINDDNIAIIELIKNSKDAGSPRVSIDFRESKSARGKSELCISDFGKGMSLDDIQYKWLNIAYSEKKNATRSDGEAYAGSKGIGRFSCDRLGTKLDIYTRSKGSSFITLPINWSEFEVDDRNKQIGEIRTVASYISPLEFEKNTGISAFEHGTCLIISDLRDDWSLDRLRSLRRELERFSIDPDKAFDVSLSHWRYEEDDEVNKPIENKIFSDLDFRTSSIVASIDKTGSYIDIELRHDGEYVFKAREKNPYSKLSSVEAKVFFLNQPAKAFFKRRTGYHSVKFGSIFLFLNGFRVFPYGSEGDDWIGLDRRRQQGHSRFFGTRDLVGYIKVSDSEDKFHAVSSREGLVKNLAFRELTEDAPDVSSSIDETKLYGFIHKAVRKLEKFVVEGLDWDRIVGSLTAKPQDLLEGNFQYRQSEHPVFETIDSIVSIRSPSDHILDIEINIPYLSKLANQEADQYQHLVTSLEDKFYGTPIEKLKPTEKRDLSKFISRSAKEIAAKNSTNRRLEEEKSKTEKALTVEQKRRLFAEAHSTNDHERLLQLHHQVGIISDGVWKRLNGTIRRYRKNPDQYSKDDLVAIIELGQYQLDRIKSVTKLALKADFDLMTNKVTADIIQFTEEYLINFRDILSAFSLNISFRNPQNVKLEKIFKPIELTMLIDNLLVNAGKSDAKKMTVSVQRRQNQVLLSFIDNGAGLTSRFEAKDLFEKGISTTSGSGVGLNHAQQIVEEMGGVISIQNAKPTGAAVQIEFTDQ